MIEVIMCRVEVAAWGLAMKSATLQQCLFHDGGE